MAFLIGRTSFEVGALVQSGRQALLKQDFAEALDHFADAAKQAPEYIYKSAHFSQGIWTYVGRAQYATGRLHAARQSLEQALAMVPDDYLAQLYLGLTLFRCGDQARAMMKMQNAMERLYDWIEHIVASRPFQAYWDPNRQIRNALKKTIAMVGAANSDRLMIVAGAEWLGQEIEEEIERARRDESRQYQID